MNSLGATPAWRRIPRRVPNGQLRMERYGAAYVTIGRVLPQHDMTTTLPHSDKTEALQRSNRFLA